MKKKGIEPISKYEKQVLWISGQDELINSKLKGSGKNTIQIPALSFRDIQAEYNTCFRESQFLVINKIYIILHACCGAI